MKVFIIAHDFMPFAKSYGSIARVANLYRYLRNQGHTVNVICKSGKEYSWFGCQNWINANDIHAISLMGLRKCVSSSFSSSSDFAKSHNTDHYYPNMILKFIKRIFLKLRSRLFIIDRGIFILPAYYFYLRRLLEVEKPDLIIVSVPKHSLSLLLRMRELKDQKQVLKILDYRDSWNTGKIFSPAISIFKKITKGLEQLSLERADIITVATKPIMEKLKNSFSVSGSQIEILNGFEGNVEICSREMKNTVRLVHFGTANDRDGSYRNIRKLIEAVQKNKSFSLDLYGDVQLDNISLTA